MSRIGELEHAIRECINSPRKHHALFQDRVEFHKLCSCLDVIGDTELAFAAYAGMPDATSSGSSYILVYGFLQALFLQQDAVRHLHEALRLRYEPDRLLTEIRDLRNDAIGHPTKRGGGRGQTFSFISRPTISKSGFQLMTVTPGKSPPLFRYVSLAALLSTQHRQLETALTTLLKSLKKEDMEHRQKFREEKLTALFPSTLHYYFEKVYESTRGVRGWEYGGLHVRLITEVVEKFRAALRRRGIAGAYDAVEHQLDSLDYPLAELAKYFADEGKSRLNERDAVIFTSFVEHEMSELLSMAGELDEEYSEKQEPPNPRLQPTGPPRTAGRKCERVPRRARG